MEVIDRDTAFMQGRVRYFTSHPCRNGHISERYVAGGACIMCIRPNASWLLEKFITRVHPDDIPAMHSFVEALNEARALQGELEAPPVPKGGQALSREQREKNWGRQLRKNGQKWRPMPPAPGDPDYTGPEPVNAFVATWNGR